MDNWFYFELLRILTEFPENTIINLKYNCMEASL